MRKVDSVGFTLVEVLVVISIIALLASIIVPVFMGINRSQRQNSCMNNLRQIGVALTQYRQDYNAYPPAPQPQYLQSQGSSIAEMPITKQPDEVQYTWQQENVVPQAQPLSVAAHAGDSTITVNGPPHLFVPSTHLLLADPTANVAEVVDISTVSGTTVTLTAPLAHDYSVQSIVDPRVDNFGLMTMYYLYYFLDQHDYLKVYHLFHCPAFEETVNVDRWASVNALHNKDVRGFDPLMGGYNTYDITYNYDQFDSAIQACDLALGLPGLNSARQLRNPDAPSDTVVCWCYGHHATGLTLDLPEVDIDHPALVWQNPDPTQASVERNMVRQLENAKNGTRDLVLLADGTVDIVRPSLMCAKVSGGQHKYYWLPNYLYSGGVWHQ